MATLEILTIPDTRLKHKSIKVENFDGDLKKLLEICLKLYMHLEME